MSQSWRKPLDSSRRVEVPWSLRPNYLFSLSNIGLQFNFLVCVWNWNFRVYGNGSENWAKGFSGNAPSPRSPHLQRVLPVGAQTSGDRRPHRGQHYHLSPPLPLRVPHSSDPASLVQPSPHSQGRFSIPLLIAIIVSFEASRF